MGIGALSISLAVISDGLYALPHAPGATGGKITLNFKNILCLCSVNSNLQIPPRCTANVSPDMKAASRVLTSSFNQSFWLGRVVIFLATVTVIHTFTDVTAYS